MSQEDAPGEHLAKQKIAASLVSFNKIVQDSHFIHTKKTKVKIYQIQMLRNRL